MKYNSFVNPFISCKTDNIISHYKANAYCNNAGAGYKEVTLKNHGNNGLAILHGNLSSYIGSIPNNNFFVNPFSSDAYRTIHYNAGHSYIHVHTL